MVVAEARQLPAAVAGLRRPRVDRVARCVRGDGFVVLDGAVEEAGVGPVAHHRAQAGVAAGRAALRGLAVLPATTRWAGSHAGRGGVKGSPTYLISLATSFS